MAKLRRQVAQAPTTGLRRLPDRVNPDRPPWPRRTGVIRCGSVMGGKYMPHSRRRALGRSVVGPWLPCIGLVLAALALASLHAQDLRAQDLRAQDLRAQDYPNRTVRVVVPFPAGGTADAMPRIIGDWLARKWGQAVVIENKAGAGGNVGAEVVANAEPDGYTLLSSPPPPLVINQNLYPKLGFD